MRPVLLDLDGFGSFREPCTVDFRDADYFALVGPTGAGKSTVIDAIVFALYGSVPRWDDRRAISWALAPTAVRGVVRLVFDVAGARYVAARELRRAARGQVTVRNARLERLADPDGLGAEGEAGEVLAADSEVTRAVEELLGLSYEHFVTCVVLPQGDFAEFLHEKPAKRQEVLARLLGLDVYRRVGQAANAEATAHRQRADLAAQQLDRYADATEEAERAARGRATELDELAGEVARRVPALAAATGRVAEAEHYCRRLASERSLLTGLRVPEGLDELDGARRSAASALAAAEDRLAAAEEADGKAREARGAAPPRAELERARDGCVELRRLERDLPVAEAELVACRATVAGLEADGRAARAEQQAARDAREALHRADLVGAVREQLAVGEPCPVCEQAVTSLPPHRGLPRLDDAERRLADADRAVDRLQRSWQEAQRKAEAVAGRLDVLRERVDGLRSALAGADADEVAAALGDLDRLEEEARRADVALRAARRERDAAARAVTAADRDLQEAWRDLDAARDPLVGLGAPAPGRMDLGSDWATLVAWARTAAADRERALRPAEDALAAARAELAGDEEELGQLLRSVAVPLPAGRALAESAEPAVAGALAQARADAARVAERREEAAALAADRARAEEEEQIARLLGQLLRADGFERWLLASALDVLVEDATRTLLELSGGQFELAHDGKDFTVIDHADADSRRPVRTLSGGETFQASLALALALSAQLSGLAAAGSARLDAILLDEGFGSLDEASLDVVAATLETLAAGGDRMVGLVTHVGALAERVPVRFAVSRDRAGSTVRREDA